MGSCEELFLQIQPYLISHLNLVWNPMLIMSLFVLGIGFLQNIVDLLEDVLDPFNEFVLFFSLELCMG